MNSDYDFSVINVLRRKLNLTLQKLAEEAGLTYPTVETIEANKTVPSLRTLDALAGALQISTSNLIALAERRLVQKRKAKNIQDVVPAVKTEGVASSMVVSFDKAKILRVKLKKDETFHLTELHEDTNEFCYVLKGAINIHIDKQTFGLDENETLLFDGVFDHYYVAKEDSEFMAVHIPKDNRIIETLLSSDNFSDMFSA